MQYKESKFESFQDITKNKLIKKPPILAWQDMALRVIFELKIPKYKKSAVFRVCKENSKQTIELCLNDTKELCERGEKWKYFFKLVSAHNPYSETYSQKFRKY